MAHPSASSPGEVVFSATVRDTSIRRLAALAIASGLSFGLFILSIGFAPYAIAALLGVVFAGCVATLAWSELRGRGGTTMQILRTAAAGHELVVPEAKIAMHFPLELAGAKRSGESAYAIVLAVTDQGGRATSFGASDIGPDEPQDPWFENAERKAADDARFLLADAATVIALRRAIERINAART